MIRRLFLAAGLAAGLAVSAPSASAATVLTGDRLDGVAVIERLDVSDAPVGQITRYYFRVLDQASGQGWYVPVLVARGAKPGKRLLLTAAIHGDELNGIEVIHQLFAGLDPARAFPMPKGYVEEKQDADAVKPTPTPTNPAAKAGADAT